MSRPENKNDQQGEQVRGMGMGKSHIIDPTIVRSMLEKERGGTLEKTSTLEKHLLVIMACHIKIVVTCTHYNVTTTLCYLQMSR